LISYASNAVATAAKTTPSGSSVLNTKLKVSGRAGRGSGPDDAEVGFRRGAWALKVSRLRTTAVTPRAAASPAGNNQRVNLPEPLTVVMAHLS
jgi:hypothetical protein